MQSLLEKARQEVAAKIYSPSPQSTCQPSVVESPESKTVDDSASELWQQSIKERIAELKRQKEEEEERLRLIPVQLGLKRKELDILICERAAIKHPRTRSG